MLSRFFRCLPLVLLASSALAAQQDKPKETPRALYEKGAYAEEHERDFQKAADFFAAAAAAATQAGDDKTAVEASAARDRALARSGQTPKTQTPVDCNDPILRRIADLLDSVSRMPSDSGEYSAAKRDLALFGAAAVPWVERAVSENISLCNFTIVARSDRFVSVLAAMGTPEATEALGRLLDSPDPVTRRDVANRSFSDRHAEILRRALADPVQDVRNAAVRNISRYQDPAWLSEMLEAARAGSFDALDYLFRTKPEALVDLALDPKLTDEFRAKAVELIGKREGLVADSTIPARLLKLAGAAGEDMGLRRSAVITLTKQVDGSWRTAPAAFRQEIETAAAADVDAYPVPEIWDLLLALGGARSLEALTGSIASKIDVLDDRQFQQLSNRLQQRFNDLTPRDFDAVVAALSKVPPVGLMRSGALTRSQRLYDLYRDALNGLARAEVPDASIIAASGKLQANHRAAFNEMFINWINQRVQRISGKERRTPLDPALIPSLRELVALGASDNNLAQAVAGFGLTADVRLWPELLPLRSLQSGAWAGLVDPVIGELIAPDPAQAAAILDATLQDSAKKNGSLDPALLRGLGFLDSASALAIFRKLWPLAKDEQGRAALLRVLVKNIPGPAATAVVFEHYKEIPPTSSDLRNDAIIRFGNELYQPAVEVLGQALEDPTDFVRKNAREAFTKFKAQREAMEEFKAWMSTDKAARDSTAQLVALLENPNKDVVLGAVRSLATLKAKSALPALVKLLEKNDPDVKKAVQDAITKIGE